MITHEEAKMLDVMKLKELTDEINKLEYTYEDIKEQIRNLSSKETSLLNQINGLKKEAREISEVLFSERL